MKEIKPPWVAHPGYPPHDIFWRQPGEAWAVHVWLPYWTSLSPDEQAAFLDKWDAPVEWREYYSPEFQAWLAELDGPGGFVMRNNLCVQSEAAIRADREQPKPQKKPPGLLSKVGTVLKIVLMAVGGGVALLGVALFLGECCYR